MTDSRYGVLIYWSEADEAFIAEVPELPGCAADGSTYEEALSNVQRVIAEWLETAMELGRPVPDKNLAYSSPRNKSRGTAGA
jgi:predicted RNase H-like HicB family nuclease